MKRLHAVQAINYISRHHINNEAKERRADYSIEGEHIIHIAGLLSLEETEHEQAVEIQRQTANCSGAIEAESK
jgi:hypothetical protein